MKQPWKTSQWFTSTWNHTHELRTGRRLPSRVTIHDVTLRDGEQQSGIVLDLEQRLTIARKLAAAGVHRIEVGMPAESEEDSVLLETLAAENLDTPLMAFAKCNPKHVEVARRHGATGIVLKTITSEHLLRAGARRSPAWAVQSSIEAIKAAGEAGLYCVLFTIDATRTEISNYVEFLEEVCEKAQPDAIAIADSYGVVLPEAIALVVRKLKTILKLPIEVHCHNDFGLATACTLSGIAAGAEVAHVTICGIGERAGNASLEETAMALTCLYDIDVGIHTEALYDLARTLQEYAGIRFPGNRPIVGDTLYQIQTDVVAELHRRCKDSAPLEYLPFLPEIAGRPGVEIALGKASGRANVLEQLAERGLTLPSATVDQLTSNVRQRVMRSKRMLTSTDFDELLAQVRE